MIQEPSKKLCLLIWSFTLSVGLIWIYWKQFLLKEDFLGISGMYFMLDILLIIFWFSFNAMYLGENNSNLSETKRCFFIPNPFSKWENFYLIWEKIFLIIINFWHDIKVAPGPWVPDFWTLVTGTRDPPQNLKVRPGTPLKFKSGTVGTPSKFKSGTPSSSDTKIWTVN